MPFAGPIGAARVGYKDGAYVLNPTRTEPKESTLDLVVAGTAGAVLMVESEADSLSEDVMLGAVVFGHAQMQVAITAINELVKQAGKPRWEWTAPAADAELVGLRVQQARRPRCPRPIASPRSSSATPRSARSRRPCSPPCRRWMASRSGRAGQVGTQLHNLESRIVRQRILNGEPRIDGRDFKTVRPINVKVRHAAAHPRLLAVHAR